MRTLVSAAVAATLVGLPPAAAAQTIAPLPGTPAAAEVHLALKQLTLPIAKFQDADERARHVAEFQAAAKAMTSCDDADGVARDLGVEVATNSDLPLSAVPVELRSELATMPIGTATRMFGQRDSEVRVLLLCGRSPR